ncbi:hypothetical protein GH714_024797 [Hevea brasiliensis]|uniref:Serine-threonine/tyrosine-protein kinase catalytic domain-containing protein n=1 Tax=Hevea brasiliensis TaxID=3981 RepID=A0A6A6LGF6_HEVBR|nr:hypothetical protein GH714_024797 [Hevea brasiliensis]
MNEIEILSSSHHMHLVSLYGCTSLHSHGLLLLREYVPNGKVADHLHGERAKPGALPWSSRLNIAVGTAKVVTVISIFPQGTLGYVDPEYHECHQLSDKSDVYSFGVLIELISSMPAVDITRH